MIKYTGRQIWGSPAIEDRVHALEGRVAVLAEAVRILAHGLEDLPTDEPAGNRAAQAARQAHDLLLAAGLPHAPPAEGDPGA
jgi:hypothetical protein